ncbi:MAG: formylglycine-generating enzyme family protein [Deltaproteobacteria bacterium]|nr:formylglycine-generating enzyme family protein [Deltaproteobacteria bacterium]
MATNLRKLRVFTILFMFHAMIAAREIRAAAAVEPQGGKFAGMVMIPAGEFTMGREGGPRDEAPAHKLFLPAFYIDRNLVTARECARFIQEKGPTGPKGEMYLDVADPDVLVHNRDGKWLPKEGFENHPVGELSRYGAAAYCAWAGKRLPSEAEWEKAARGTDGRLYPWGNDMPRPDLAFIGGYRGQTVPVGRFPKGASPYGALDMAGQVWEWTRSVYRSYPYIPKDGREEAAPADTVVARGGHSASGPEGLTSTSREAVDAGRAATGHAYIGFRCVSDSQLVL